METLTPIQHAAVMALYDNEMATTARVWYVKGKKLNVESVRTLFKLGMIETDRDIDGIPARFRLTESGLEYGREHDKRYKSPSGRKD